MRFARCLFLLALLSLTVSCASHKTHDTETMPQAEKNVDPWEGFNRKMFAFNKTLDRWILKPVAKTYDFILPDFVQVGIGNFFRNIGEVGNVGNLCSVEGKRKVEACIIRAFQEAGAAEHAKLQAGESYNEWVLQSTHKQPQIHWHSTCVAAFIADLDVQVLG